MERSEVRCILRFLDLGISGLFDAALRRQISDFSQNKRSLQIQPLPPSPEASMTEGPPSLKATVAEGPPSPEASVAEGLFTIDYYLLTISPFTTWLHT